MNSLGRFVHRSSSHSYSPKFVPEWRLTSRARSSGESRRKEISKRSPPLPGGCWQGDNLRSETMRFSWPLECVLPRLCHHLLLTVHRQLAMIFSTGTQGPLSGDRQDHVRTVDTVGLLNKRPIPSIRNPWEIVNRVALGSPNTEPLCGHR